MSLSQNATLNHTLQVLEQIADSILGAPGVAYGFVQFYEDLEEVRGAKQQQGFDVAHKRTGGWRIGVSDGKHFFEASSEDLIVAVVDAFGKLRKPLPALIEAGLPDPVPESEPGLYGRGKLKVVCTACIRCGDEDAPRYVESTKVHVRLGRGLRPVTLLLCAKCAESDRKKATPKEAKP